MARNNDVKVRFTDVELVLLKKLTREAGYKSPARYLRDRGLKQHAANYGEAIHVSVPANENKEGA